MPYHVFGEHKKCETYFYKKEYKNVNFMSEFSKSDLLIKIMEAVNLLADDAKSLLYNVSNNSVAQNNWKI